MIGRAWALLAAGMNLASPAPSPSRERQYPLPECRDPSCAKGCYMFTHADAGYCASGCRVLRQFAATKPGSIPDKTARRRAKKAAAAAKAGE